MKAPMLSGLRGRALLLVLLAAVPVLALLLYQGHQAGVAAKRLALEHADGLRRFIAAAFDDQIEETRRLLKILARAEPGRCTALAADFNRHDKHYANIGATTPSGDIWCSALPSKGPVNLRDRAWFKSAVATRNFTFGEVVIGRIAKRPVLVMALPAYDSAGGLRAAYFASLDLVWFSEYAARAKLPPGSTVSVLDNEGRVLSRYPDAEKWVGAVRDNDFMQHMRAGLPAAAFEQTGLDGVPRLYAAAPLTEAEQKSPVYLAVGIPLDKAHADLRQIRARSLALLAAVVLIVLVVAGAASERVLLRPLQALTAAARRLSEGDLHTRTGLVRQQDEVGELARVFDDMANQLQVRGVEFARAMGELRESEARFRRLAENAPDIIYRTRLTDPPTLEYVSPAITRVLGYSPEELYADPALLPTKVVHPEMREWFAREHADMEAWVDKVATVRFLHRDGHEVLLERRHMPVRDETGRLVAVEGIARDVTAHVRAEERLQKSNEMLERIFENTQFHLAYLDRDFNFIRVNKAYANAGKQPPEFFTGKNHFALYPGAEVETIFRRVAETGEPYTAYARPFEYPDQPERGVTYWDWTLSPVRNNSGEVSGLILSLVDVTERVKAEQYAGYLYLHDQLTGLPNRELLLDRLHQTLVEAARHGREAAVLCLDLDRFKYLNETAGHAAGDMVLKEAAGRLTQCVRPGDTVARLQGDQFAVVLADMASTDDVAKVLQKLMGCGATPIRHESHEYFMTMSLGVALFPEDGKEAEALLKSAELAMHEAKERGGNSYQFYSRDMASRAAEHLALERSLRQALEQGQFLLYYQPQVDIASQRIVGAEALIRWKHPQRGLVAPATFIPLAEETGLIVPIGEWVLRQACDQARAWRAAGLPDLRIAVNVSAEQFRHNNIAHTVERALAEFGLPPEALEIEVTESLLMPGDEAPQVLLRKLAELGVRIAIDDFGTGYSGLSYLKRFPIGCVKIDQSFVRNLATDNDDASIVNAIVAMAQSLEVMTVAEGVETGAQLAMLQAYGCDLAQGFYFSPPLPADEFARLLRAQQDRRRGKDCVS